MTNFGIMIASFSLFILSMYFYKKPVKYKFTLPFYFIIIFISFLLYIAYSVSDYLSGNGIDDATIYHLKYGLGGAGFLEYKNLIILTIFIILLGSILFFWFFSKKKTSDKGNILIAYSLLLLSLLVNPASIDIYKAFNVNYTESDEFYKYYKKPYIEQITDNTKNLVFIYGESLERTYFNQKVFPGLIKELRKINGKVISFSDIIQVPGNGYTIGGIVNSQLGIPLVTTSYGNSMSGMDKFLPSAIGLGDLLHDKNYYLAFYGGAKLTFAGKGKFFKTHGFDEVLGRDELYPRLKDKNYLNGWGLYDDTLLDIVYERFIELSKKNKRFGLFTLTLDTHHPNGHISKSCNSKYKDGSNPILNAVVCSDYLISKFINKIISSPYAKNTIIVLVSDHIALRNTAHSLLTSKIRVNGKIRKINRRNLFMIIDPTGNQHERANIFGSNFDIGSTILPFIGYKGDIGLGRNLLLNKEKNTSIKQFKRRNKKKLKIAKIEKTYIMTKLKHWKGMAIKFWNFPRLKNKLEIDLASKTVHLDKRKFKLPILILLNEQFLTTLKFQFNRNRTQQSLVEQLSEIEKDKYFILIDKGTRVNTINDKFNGEDFYLIAGKGNTYTKMMKLEEKQSFSTKEINKFLNKK